MDMVLEKEVKTASRESCIFLIPQTPGIVLCTPQVLSTSIQGVEDTAMFPGVGKTDLTVRKRRIPLVSATDILHPLSCTKLKAALQI